MKQDLFDFLNDLLRKLHVDLVVYRELIRSDLNIADEVSKAAESTDSVVLTYGQSQSKTIVALKSTLGVHHKVDLQLRLLNIRGITFSCRQAKGISIYQFIRK